MRIEDKKSVRGKRREIKIKMDRNLQNDMNIETERSREKAKREKEE